MIVFAMLGPFKFTHRISPPSPPSKYHIAALLHPSKTESLQQFQCSPIFHYSLVIIVQVRAMTMMLGIVWHRKDHLTSSGSTAEMMDDGRWGGRRKISISLVDSGTPTTLLFFRVQCTSHLSLPSYVPFCINARDQRYCQRKEFRASTSEFRFSAVTSS